MSTRPTFGAVRPPHTPGMELLEQAMHKMDVEGSKYLLGEPVEVLIRLEQIEHCYVTLMEHLHHHLPEDMQTQFPVPTRVFGVRVRKYLQQIGYQTDAD